MAAAVAGLGALAGFAPGASAESLPPATGDLAYDSVFAPEGVSVAVDDASHDVYNLAFLNGFGYTVTRFDSRGNVLATWPADGGERYSAATDVSVNPKTHEVFVADYEFGCVRRYDATGTFLGEFGRPCSFSNEFVEGVAVDPANGRVYITNYLHDRVEERSRTGKLVRGFPQPGESWQLGDPRKLDVGPSHDVYVVDQRNTLIRRVSPDGTLRASLGGGELHFPGWGIGVDHRSGDVYVPDRPADQILHYGPGDAFLGRMGGPVTSPYDLAVDHGKATAYVTARHEGSANGDILRYRPRATTRSARGVTATSATARGIVRPDGENTTYSVHYRAVQHSSWRSAGVWHSNSETPVPVAVKLADLSPEREYVMQIHAQAAGHPEVTTGSRHFTTKPLAGAH